MLSSLFLFETSFLVVCVPKAGLGACIAVKHFQVNGYILGETTLSFSVCLPFPVGFNS